MDSLYHYFGDKVKGLLNGFDRIVFKGNFRQFMYEGGIKSFLQRKKVLNKDYKDWALEQTKRIIDDAEQLSQSQRQCSIKQFRGSDERKDEVAHQVQEEQGISEGLIGIWSALECCHSYKACFKQGQSFPEMRSTTTKCKHLYYYFDHQDYGFMNIRLQTWFPFSIQIAMNGREWLRRSLDKAGISYERRRNKFTHIDDMEAAQRLLSAQLDTDWAAMLNGFLPKVFPSIDTALLPNLSYYWTLWQSEWASDYLFHSQRDLQMIGNTILKHAFMTGTASRVLRYMDRPFTKDGIPYASNNNDVKSRYLDFLDGIRVRHWVDKNSVKAYTELNNFRIETTMNAPGAFYVMRRKEGDAPDAPKKKRQMRKGVADIAMRASISQDINNRLADQLATCTQEETLSDTFNAITKPTKKKGRRVRALDPIGKDRELLMALTDPAYTINGVTNKMLKEKLKKTTKGMTDKQASAKISRLLRTMRDHGLIAKYQKRRRYRVTAKGLNISTATAALLSASTKRLMDNAA